MTSVRVLAPEGAMRSSVAITFDVLDTANRVRARTFTLVDGEADLVVLPGLGLTSGAEVRDFLARADAVAAGRVLTDAVARGAEVATSCSGAFLPAALGLLDGRRATTSWWLAPLFRRLHPAVDLDADALVVRDGPITTAGAAMAHLDLMLTLVARHGGADLADRCARYLLADVRAGQSNYMALGFLTASDPDVAAAERWARAHLEEDVSVADLAAAVGLSTRTFARRVERATGHSPVRFLQRLRVETALDLLTTTDLPVADIARRVGYADPTTLRRVLRRDTGRSPRDLRGHAGGDRTSRRAKLV
ncbi:GlxA family transcriptional regulator [Saccharothrix variisporea]|uniref:Transcriptional regulator GlxA family with amidase domain n=1 Tax=Saccharothrix variisporea TaxID=543527 RepID=A0A495WZB3_9PSEU|nr:helix-turn-helix domain-containing protein [Saccharothrix variisporea]RKT67032.1 transcriptional regulator GlxA family with amidase domain [Saccharothrix variisporea]